MRKLILVTLAAAALAACHKDEAVKLPPARGEGAPPLPNLPKIGENKEGSSVSPTEGQTTGTTYAKQEAQLAPNAGGLITQIAVEEGTRVKKGQVLFQLDVRDGELRVQGARAQLAAAEVNMRATKTEYDRAKMMLDQNAINRAAWDQIEARFEGAKVGVDQAKVGVQMAEKALADTTVRAPFDGVITTKLKSVGEMATMMPPTVVLVLVQDTTLDLKFRLPERALATLKPGEPVTARFDALAITRGAKVARIQPTVDARTRTVEVVAEIPNSDHSLRPGLLAEVTIGEAPAEETAHGETNAP